MGRYIGFVGGKLRFVSLEFGMTILLRRPPAVIREVYNIFERFLDDFSKNAPSSLQKCFITAESTFTWMITQERLVVGLFTGLGISFPVAFLVLLFATGNLRLAVFAIIAIFLIVSSLLGTCFQMGWELGVGEAIAGTIVIGLAVDYTVHLGHCYTESVHEAREAKTTDAATIMGCTVLAGGVTTFGCSVFMFFCQLTFFTKMAILIGGTVAYSLLYSLFFFMPLCALLGPAGRLKSSSNKLLHCYKRLRLRCRKSRKDNPNTPHKGEMAMPER